MRETPERRSALRATLHFLAALLMVAAFTTSIVCIALAYRTWSGSVVRVHRGLNAPQRSYTHLSNEQKTRIKALLGGAAGSAVVGAVVLVSRKGRISGRR